MNKINRLIACGAIAAFALTGCGASGGANAPAPNTQASVSSNVLQFAVGTVNLFGTANGGLNVVATYRQPSGGTLPGGSGTLLNSPTITVPAAIPGTVAAPAGSVEGFDASSTAAFGAGTGEVGGTTIQSTSQSVTAAICGTPTTFGQSGGVFGLGIEPFNSTGQGDCTPPAVSGTGTPFQVAPYPVPLWDTTNAGCATAPLCDPNQLDAAWGGPPAIVYPGTGGDNISGGSAPGGTLGLSMGIDVFQGLAAAAGTYKLSTSIPANTGTTTATASYALAAVTDLGTAGAAPAFVENGHGGGTVGPLVLPPGAWTEALVEVIDYPAAGGPGLYYTMEAVNGTATAWCTTAPVTCTLPNAIGPGGTASITAGDNVVTQVIFTDYPIYELQYGSQASSSTGKTSPTLLGAAGSADMSISTANCEATGASCVASLPLIRSRASTLRMGHVVAGSKRR